MRIVCQQTILMKYHNLFVIFEKKQQNLKLSFAAKYRWRFKGKRFAYWVFLCCCRLLVVLKSFLFENFLQEYHQSVKQYGSISGPTWVQTVFKVYQQTTLVGKG